MAHLWLDISAGVAGDMILGALLDAGAPLDAVQSAVDAVIPGAVRLSLQPVTRGGQRAAKLSVDVLVEDPPHRTWREIRTMLERAELSAITRERALAVFERLAAAEARAHGVAPEEIHFHEVGALDSIADVVGTCAATELLRIDTCTASPVAVGAGRVRVAHGDVGVPVPAVAELVRGWRVLAAPAGGHTHSHPAVPAEHDDHGSSHTHEPHSHSHSHDRPAEIVTPGEIGELATPTGMAIVRALAATCGALPPMVLASVGVGAGGRDIAGRPNTVRALIGEVDAGADTPPRDVVELRANVDDMDPRMWPQTLALLLDHGALDAWLVPIHMKKGRPAFTLHALTAAEDSAAVTELILRHTTTLGVRACECRRTTLERRWQDVTVLGQTVQVKMGERDGVLYHAAVEYDSLAEAARATGMPLPQLAQQCQAQIAAAGLVPEDRA